MNDTSKKPTSEANSGNAPRSFTKAGHAVPLFILGGCGAAYVTFLSCMVAFYGGQRFSDRGFLIHYVPALLFLPAFLLALMRRRVASVPIWLVCLWFLIPSFLPAHQTASGIGEFQPGIGIFCIPALAQLARHLRAKKPARNDVPR